MRRRFRPNVRSVLENTKKGDSNNVPATTTETTTTRTATPATPTRRARIKPKVGIVGSGRPGNFVQRKNPGNVCKDCEISKSVAEAHVTLLANEKDVLCSEKSISEKNGSGNVTQTTLNVNTELQNKDSNKKNQNTLHQSDSEQELQSASTVARLQGSLNLHDQYAGRTEEGVCSGVSQSFLNIHNGSQSERSNECDQKALNQLLSGEEQQNMQNASTVVVLHEGDESQSNESNESNHKDFDQSFLGQELLSEGTVKVLPENSSLQVDQNVPLQISTSTKDGLSNTTSETTVDRDLNLQDREQIDTSSQGCQRLPNSTSEVEPSFVAVGDEFQSNRSNESNHKDLDQSFPGLELQSENTVVVLPENPSLQVDQNVPLQISTSSTKDGLSNTTSETTVEKDLNLQHREQINTSSQGCQRLPNSTSEVEPSSVAPDLVSQMSDNVPSANPCVHVTGVSDDQSSSTIVKDGSLLMQETTIDVAMLSAEKSVSTFVENTPNAVVGCYPLNLNFDLNQLENADDLLLNLLSSDCSNSQILSCSNDTGMVEVIADSHQCIPGSSEVGVLPASDKNAETGNTSKFGNTDTGSTSVSTSVAASKLVTKRQRGKPRRRISRQPVPVDISEIPIASNVEIDTGVSSSETPVIDHPVLELPVDLVEEDTSQEFAQEMTTTTGLKQRFRQKNSGMFKMVVSRQGLDSLKDGLSVQKAGGDSTETTLTWEQGVTNNSKKSDEVARKRKVEPNILQVRRKNVRKNHAKQEKVHNLDNDDQVEVGKTAPSEGQDSVTVVSTLSNDVGDETQNSINVICGLSSSLENENQNSVSVVTASTGGPGVENQESETVMSGSSDNDEGNSHQSATHLPCLLSQIVAGKGQKSVTIVSTSSDNAVESHDSLTIPFALASSLHVENQSSVMLSSPSLGIALDKDQVPPMDDLISSIDGQNENGMTIMPGKLRNPNVEGQDSVAVLSASSSDIMDRNQNGAPGLSANVDLECQSFATSPVSSSNLEAQNKSSMTILSSSLDNLKDISMNIPDDTMHDILNNMDEPLSSIAECPECPDIMISTCITTSNSNAVNHVNTITSVECSAPRDISEVLISTVGVTDATGTRGTEGVNERPISQENHYGEPKRTEVSQMVSEVLPQDTVGAQGSKKSTTQNNEVHGEASPNVTSNTSVTKRRQSKAVKPKIPARRGRKKATDENLIPSTLETGEGALTLPHTEVDETRGPGEQTQGDNEQSARAKCGTPDVKEKTPQVNEGTSEVNKETPQVSERTVQVNNRGQLNEDHNEVSQDIPGNVSGVKRRQSKAVKPKIPAKRGRKKATDTEITQTTAEPGEGTGISNAHASETNGPSAGTNAVNEGSTPPTLENQAEVSKDITDNVSGGKRRQTKAVKPRIPAKRGRKKAADKELVQDATQAGESTAITSRDNEGETNGSPQQTRESSGPQKRKRRASTSKRSAESDKNVSAETASLARKKSKQVQPVMKDGAVNIACMRMSDMIYYNPKTNPMRSTSNDQTQETINDAPRAPNDQSEVVLPADEQQQDAAVENDGGEKQGAVLAPQVTIDADGNIVLDEESLLIQAPVVNEDAENRELVFENANQQYSSAMKKMRSDRWKKEETLYFYEVLSQIGTDFSLMTKLFPKRSRTDLKKKFKREEKRNRDLIEKALNQRNPIHASLFAECLEETEEEMERALVVSPQENVAQA